MGAGDPATEGDRSQVDGADDRADDSTDDFEGFMGDDWGELMRQMHQLDGDMPIADFMARYFGAERYAALRESVRRFAEGYDLADLHRVSTRSLYREWSREGEDEEYRIGGGYRRLIDFMVEDLKSKGGELHLSSPVMDIAWNKGRVEVWTVNGKVYTSDTLIVSVSLAMLEKKLLRFSPALPEIDAAIRQLGFGSIIKILFEFKQAFWLKMKQKDQTLFILSDQPIPTWWTQSDDESRLMTGWLAGEGMRRFQSLDPEGRRQLCMESLAAIFSLDARHLRQELIASLVLDWAVAPFVCGGYSFDTVGAADARALLSQPVEGTLWFCGEALYEGEAPGTVEAALSSGLAVAERIIAQP
jgi:monoamine oxidase